MLKNRLSFVLLGLIGGVGGLYAVDGLWRIVIDDAVGLFLVLSLVGLLAVSGLIVVVAWKGDKLAAKALGSAEASAEATLAEVQETIDAAVHRDWPRAARLAGQSVRNVVAWRLSATSRTALITATLTLLAAVVSSWTLRLQFEQISLATKQNALIKEQNEWFRKQVEGETARDVRNEIAGLRGDLLTSDDGRFFRAITVLLADHPKLDETRSWLLRLAMESEGDVVCRALDAAIRLTKPTRSVVRSANGSFGPAPTQAGGWTPVGTPTTTSLADGSTTFLVRPFPAATDTKALQFDCSAFIRPLFLKEADLSGLSIQGKLPRANLNGALFRRTDVGLADLSGANLMGAWFTEATFVRSSVKGADLGMSWLDQVRFEGVDFSETNWHSSRLRSVRFQSSDLSAADMRHVTVPPQAG